MTHITRRGAGRRVRAAAALLVLGPALAVAQPASAAVIPESFTESFEGESEICGIPVAETGTFSVDGHLRVGKGRAESLFFARVHTEFRATITSLETGRSFTTEGRARFVDVKAVPVGGSVFEVRSIEAGQTFVLRDAAGRVVLRDRGRIATTILFDTLGDDTPGGEFIDLIDEDLAGRHPGFTFDDEGRFCDVVQDLLG
jgi:hypothetical protein